MKRQEKKDLLKKQYKLLSSVMPNQVIFQNHVNEKNMMADNLYSAVLYLYEMPDQVEFGWDNIIKNLLTKTKLENQVKIDVRNISEFQSKKMLSRDTQNIKNNFNSKSLIAQSKQKEFALKNEIANEINSESLSLVEFIYRIYFVSTDEALLNKKIAEFIVQSSQKGFKFSYSLYNNKYNYKSKFINLSDQLLDPIYAEKPLIIPSTVLALMYYNNGNGFYDPYGQFIGSSSGQKIMYDSFRKTASRNSFNLSIFGDSGAGKSTLIKNLLLGRISLNDKAIIFDFEDEFSGLTDYCGGKNFNLRKDKFNPFQIFSFEDHELSDDEETELKNIKQNSDLSTQDKNQLISEFIERREKRLFANTFNNHITFLKELIYIINSTFFKEADSTKKLTFDTYIQKFLVKFYQEEQKINFKNYQKIEPEEYLTLKDFIVYCLNQDLLINFSNNNFTENQKDNFDFLKMILENMLNNQTLLNYLSNQSNTKITTETILNFQLRELNLVSDKTIKLSVMYYLLYLMESFVLNNRSKNEDIIYDEKIQQNVIIPKSEIDREHIIVVIDEFHILLNYEFALKRLSELVRRARKYSGAIWLSTQSLLDNIKADTEEIEKLYANIPTLFIGKQDTFNEELLKKKLPALQKAYGLHNIPNFAEGQFFAKIGNEMFIFNHELGIHENEKLAIFKGGAGAGKVQD